MRTQSLILALLCILSISPLWAQRTGSTPPKPGPFDSSLTEQQDRLNDEIQEFLKVANDQLKSCSKGKAASTNNFYAFYNYLVMVDAKGADTLWAESCRSSEEFFRCVASEKFNKSIQSIIKNPALYPLMTVDKTLKRENVDQLKKFFEGFISRYKE